MLSRIAAVVAAVVAAGIALVLVYRLYLTGNALLATALGCGLGLAFFIYTARSAYTFRYLFPGLASIALFIVLPVAYTVWIGLTNYSSRNLLTFERATEVLLDEVVRRDDARYQFTLHADGDRFRIVLQTGEDDATGEPADTSSILADPPSDPGDAAPAGAPSAATDAPAPRRAPATFVTPPLALTGTTAQRVEATPLAASGWSPGDPLPLKEVIARRDAIRALTVQFPDRSAAAMESLREFTPYEPRYQRSADGKRPGGTPPGSGPGSLIDRQSGQRLTPNLSSGYYETATGARVLPGFRTYVAGDNYARIFTDAKFRGPFFRVFAWTVVFATLSVLLTTALGLLLAELLSWEGLRFAGVYRVLLFLPYAVPGFISILVFKGLFNRNFGEINLILDAVLGIRPNWTGDATLARLMILIVNTWLGYPYFMLLGMGLQKSIPRELYEASALAGAGPLTTFFRITWPMIRKPLMPLMIASFAYNFNNFVLIYLLTQGRPDFLDTNVPAGETDLLVNYTYRIAFEDAGQSFGLAAAISTIIFVIVAILSVINLRLTRANTEPVR